MKYFAEEILAKIDTEIESIGFNNDITMDDALHMRVLLPKVCQYLYIEVAWVHASFFSIDNL